MAQQLRLCYCEKRKMHYVSLRIGAHRKVTMTVCLRAEAMKRRICEMMERECNKDLDDVSRDALLKAIEELKENEKPPKLMCTHCNKAVSLSIIYGYLKARSNPPKVKGKRNNKTSNDEDSIPAKCRRYKSQLEETQRRSPHLVDEHRPRHLTYNQFLDNGEPEEQELLDSLHSDPGQETVVTDSANHQLANVEDGNDEVAKDLKWDGRIGSNRILVQSIRIPVISNMIPVESIGQPAEPNHQQQRANDAKNDSFGTLEIKSESQDDFPETPNDDETATEPLLCQFCGKKFRFLETLQRHNACCWKGQGNLWSIYHRKSAGKVHKCRKCRRQFQQLSTLIQHSCLRNVRSGHYMMKIKNPAVCRFCNRVFTTRYSLSIHKWIPPIDALSCKHCNLKLPNFRMVYNHEKQHEQNKLPMCPYCGHLCLHPKSLSYHVRLCHLAELSVTPLESS